MVGPFVGMLVVGLFSHCGTKTMQVSGSLNTPEAAYTKAQRLLESESYVAAEAAFRQALQINPNYAPAYEGLSRSAFKQGKTNEAIRHIRMAKLKDAAYVPAWLLTGEIYRSAKQYSSAVTEYREALTRDTNQLWVVDTYYALAQTYEQKEDLEQAHEAYMQVIAIDPLHLDARAAVARTRQTLGDTFLMKLRYEKREEVLP
jgi:superkiller protein 3